MPDLVIQGALNPWLFVWPVASPVKNLSFARAARALYLTSGQSPHPQFDTTQCGLRTVFWVCALFCRAMEAPVRW